MNPDSLRESNRTRGGNPRFFIFGLLSFLTLFSAGSLLSAADLSRGKVLYDAHCASCHGIEGKGNGPAAAGFNPRPTDFTSAGEMAAVPFAANELAVAQGKPGTGMPGFGMVLSPEEIQAVIAYQRAFSGP